VIDAAPYSLVLSRLVEDGTTDTKIAERIGFSRTAVRNIRIGRTKVIHPDTAQAIAFLLAGMASHK
jgi:hypothetical protein